MQIWIDVENAAGTRYGDGPIITASEWQSTRRLDAAGTFSFSMPASDPRSNLLANKRIVRCWRADGNGIYEVGSGIIDAITVTPGDGSTPTMLQVTGDDLLRELAYRTVGDLALHEPVEYSTTHPTDPLTLRYQGYDTGYNLTLPANVNLRPYTDPNNRETFLYFQHSRPFSSITITLSSANTTLSDTFQVQYYNAQDASPTWEAVGGLVNGAARSGPDVYSIYPFGRTGTNVISFDPPAGWSPLGGQYIIRMFDQTADLTTFGVSACHVTIEEPVSDGLQRIMALAPSGWSLDPAGKFATGNPVYMQFGGESVLSALVMLANQTGEHFILSPAARRLWWLGSEQSSSGVRAVQATEPGDSTMLISKLQRSADSYELYTRAYAYGGGEGVGRLTMEMATRDVSGYTLAADGTYLEADAAIAIYGRIDHRNDYPDIMPSDASQAQLVNAANALFDRVYQDLRRKSQLQYAYALEVVPSVYSVWPGQTLYVDYHEWIDGYHAVNIATELWVLEHTMSVTPEGLRLVALNVATVDYAPSNDDRFVTELIGSVRSARGATLPSTGFTSSLAGTPTLINVANGRVTSIGRVRPVNDGWYAVGDISEIKVINGVITNIQAA